MASLPASLQPVALTGSTSPPLPRAVTALNVRPFFENKASAFWKLQAVGWTGYFLLHGVSSVSSGVSFQTAIPLLINTIVGYCITLLLSALYGSYRKLPRVGGVLLTVVTLLAATLLYAVLDAFSFSFVRLVPSITLTSVLTYLFLDFTVLAGWSALYFGINFFLIVEAQIDQMLHLETQASSAQLAMLRYQLNPHFLFNTLNSISTLVLLKQTERANAMLSRLSSFLRYTLANEPTAHVTVAQEIETLKLYLEIEKMRFEDRLRPVFDIDMRAERARLPSLLLQPLVENAIKYAVTPQEEGAEICITARLLGDTVRIEVADTGPGIGGPGFRERTLPPSLSTGVGLANIRERLAQAYGPEGRLETRTRPTGGFAVEIEIPFELDDTRLEGVRRETA